MTNQNKKTIKISFLIGLAFAIGMYAFDYYNGEDFSIWKFLFNLTFFGVAMGFVNRNNFKEQSKYKK